MSKKGVIWIGVDPGGEGKFGVAILHEGGVLTKCVDHADEAVQFIANETAGCPSGIGVDAPLWWSSGRSSDRQADRWLRFTFGLAGGNVQTANSLEGAALVQGAMFVQRMREQYPQVPVTESHPKALWAALSLPSWDAFCDQYKINVVLNGAQEHERDAVLAAISAREGFEGRWRRDLSLDRLTSEQDPSSYWLAPVHYYWPDPCISAKMDNRR